MQVVPAQLRVREATLLLSAALPQFGYHCHGNEHIMKNIEAIGLPPGYYWVLISIFFDFGAPAICHHHITRSKAA